VKQIIQSDARSTRPEEVQTTTPTTKTTINNKEHASKDSGTGQTNTNNADKNEKGKSAKNLFSLFEFGVASLHHITVMCVYVTFLLSSFIIYQISMCIWRWLFKSYFNLDKIIKQPEDFNEGMDVEKWVSNFEKFADHNNKRQNSVRGQFLLNHMDASSRLVLESYNRKSNKSLIDYTKLKPMLFQLFSSKTTSRR
jgi:hypothetical protein